MVVLHAVNLLKIFNLKVQKLLWRVLLKIFEEYFFRFFLLICASLDNNELTLCSAQTKKPGRILPHSWVLDPHPAELTLSRNIMAKISFLSSVILSEEVLTPLPSFPKWRLSPRRKGRTPRVTRGPRHQALRSVTWLDFWSQHLPLLCVHITGKLASYFLTRKKKLNKLSYKY